MTETEAALVARVAAALRPTVWGYTRAEGRPVSGPEFGQAIAGYRAAAMTPAAPVVVPRVWPEATMVILASGPSLTRDDVTYCRHQGCRVLAIKDAIRLAPWADALYSCEAYWWQAHPETVQYSGLKLGLQTVPDRPDVGTLRATGETGLELDPTGVRTGKNSGYQAINLAVHLGARQIVLLGYDMQIDASGREHWFYRYSFRPVTSDYDAFRERMETLVEPLAAIGVSVINCTPTTALTCFERRSLRDVI